MQPSESGTEIAYNIVLSYYLLYHTFRFFVLDIWVSFKVQSGDLDSVRWKLYREVEVGMNG